MHTAVLAAKPEAQAVIHCHAPNATILVNTGLPFLPISTEAAFFVGIGAARGASVKVIDDERDVPVYSLPAALVLESGSVIWDARRWRYTAITRAAKQVKFFTNGRIY